MGNFDQLFLVVQFHLVHVMQETEPWQLLKFEADISFDF